MKYILLVGRILFSMIFIVASISHFSPQDIQYAASKGVPIPSILVPLSGIIALAGGLSVLLGYKARWGSLLIVIFLIPVTLVMHNFWVISDPTTAAMEQVNFFKNISMLGAALIISYFGSGPLSLSNSPYTK
jgi:putative oxidoreductase